MCPPRFELSDPDAFAFCPSCGAGYRAGLTRCSDCDTALKPRAEIEHLAEPDRTDEKEAGGMEIVYSTTLPWVAHMLAHSLHEKDIAARVEQEHAGTHFEQQVTLWVPRDRHAEAERIVSDIESDPPELEAETTFEEQVAESRPVETPSDSRSPAGVFAALVLGALLGYGASAWQHRAWSEEEMGFDRNGDGTEDVWIKRSLINDERIIVYDMDFDGAADRWDHYENDALVRLESDRNEDGKPDIWTFYNEMFQATRMEQDDDFDGRRDYWIQYENDHEREFFEDQDFDGRVDGWGSFFENGLLKERNVSFHNDSVADKRILFERNRRVRVELDRDRDGEFEEVTLLDEFEEPVDSIAVETRSR